MEREFRVVWAVDPGVALRLQKAAMGAIQAIVKGKQATVEPVYLMSTFLDSTPSQSFGDTVELIRTSLREKFEKTAKKIASRPELPGLKALTVLTGLNLSMRDKALDLVDYARAKGADVIVLTTHGNANIKRWVLGSFAESLMELPSGIPLLIVNPHWAGQCSFGDILFPTDFSDESRSAFWKVLDFAKTSRSRITLFHRISLTVSPELHLMMTRYPDYERFRDREVAESRKRAMGWAAEGKRRGVKVTVCVDIQGMPSVADAILSQQKRMGVPIALVSRSGDAGSGLLGRTTRAVVRGASAAVWVLHPMEKTASARMKSAA